MIRGEVTPNREAVINLRVRNIAGLEIEIQAVVDTGFTDYISLPPDMVDALNLPWLYEVPMFLAGDVRVPFDAHTGWLGWDGEWREVEVLKADGDPLIGMSLLLGYRLCLDVLDGGPVTIEKL